MLKCRYRWTDRSTPSAKKKLADLLVHHDSVIGAEWKKTVLQGKLYTTHHLDCLHMLGLFCDFQMVQLNHLSVHDGIGGRPAPEVIRGETEQRNHARLQRNGEELKEGN